MPIEQITDLIERGRYQQALPLAEQACALSGDGSSPADTDATRARRLELHGVVLRELGHYARAEAAFLEGLRLHAHAGKEHPDYARTLHELGRLYEEQAQYASAEKLFRSALAIREQALGTDHADVATSLHDLGGLLDGLARYEEAALVHARALEIRRHLGEDHPDFGLSLAAQAWGCWRRGQSERAETLLRQALDILRGRWGDEHPDCATCQQFLSRIALQQGRIEDADTLCDSVLGVRGRILGKEHHRYAGALENQSLIRAVQGRAEEAETLARKGVQISKAALGDRHPFVADGLAALAYAVQTQGQAEEAQGLYQQALDIYQSAYGEQHPNVAGCLRDLAEVAASQGRLDDAEQLYRKTLAILKGHGRCCGIEIMEALQGLSRVLAARNRGEEAIATAQEAVHLAEGVAKDEGGRMQEESGRTSDSSCAMKTSALDSLARVYHAVGRLAEAETIWKEVLAFRERAHGQDHVQVAETLRCLAGLCANLGQYDQALRHQTRAVNILRTTRGEQNPLTIQTLSGLAEMHWQRGEIQQAEELLVRVAEMERERVGEEHPDHARAVRQLARLYQSMNAIPAAEVRYRQVLELVEKAHGDENPEYAQALHDLAGLYHQVGELQRAEELYQRAAEIRQSNPGENHPDYAQSLHGLAMVYQGMGRFDEAAPLFGRAIEICEQALGADGLLTLRLRHSQALFEQASGNFFRARDLLATVCDRMETIVGPTAPLLVPVLADLGRLHSAVGDHLSAEGYWRRIMEINQPTEEQERAREQGDRNPSAMLSSTQDLLNLALCLRALGDMAAAEPLVRQALGQIEQIRGVNHPETAGCLGLLAGIVQARTEECPGPQGATLSEEAERLYRDALDRTRTALGQSHPHVAVILAELAGVCASRGRLDEALSLSRQACDLIRAAHGEDHFEHVNQLRILAGLYQAAGQYTEAEQILKQRVNILRRLFGPDSPVLVPAQQLLADLYRFQGRLDEAETLCRVALDIARRVCKENARREENQEDDRNPLPGGMFGVPGQGQPMMGEMGLALAESNLASVYLAQNRPIQAEPLLRHALEAIARSAGEDHPAHAGIRFHLALLCAAKKREDEARTLLWGLTEQDTRQLPQLLCLGAERARAFHGQGLQDSYDAYLSLTVRRLAGSTNNPSPQEMTRLYDLVLRRKRLGLELLAASSLEVWQRKYKDVAQELRRLWFLDRQIAVKRLSGPGAEGLSVHRELLAAWLEQREALEERLAEVVPEIARRRWLRQVETASVAARVAKGAVGGGPCALIDFVYYRAADLSAAVRQASPIPGSAQRAAFAPAAQPPIDQGQYLVFVLRSDQEVPILRELGPASRIDSLAQAWRQALPGTAGTAGAQEAGLALRAAIWDPIEPLVADCKELILAPDGELLQVPLDVLPMTGEQAGCLFDRFVVRSVLSGRDLLRQIDNRQTSSAIVLGEPAVSASVSRPGSEPRLLSRFWDRLRQALGSKNRGEKGGDTPPRTPGEQVLPAPVEVGATASEAENARVAEPIEPIPLSRAEVEAVARLLEVEPWPVEGAKARLLESHSPEVLHLATPGQFQADRTALMQARNGNRPANWENPLALSALMLPLGELLTAREVTLLDLWQTQVVFLSGIQAVSGHPFAWGKISGLVGALLRAGAGSVVLSLWAAPEQARLELVQNFYQRLREGRSPAEALRQARSQVRSQFPHPHAWAGWVCLGSSGERGAGEGGR